MLKALEREAAASYCRISWHAFASMSGCCILARLLTAAVLKNISSMLQHLYFATAACAPDYTFALSIASQCRCWSWVAAAFAAAPTTGTTALANQRTGYSRAEHSLTTHTPVLSQVLSQDIDLLHPPVELEKQKNKRKRLVQSPNSFFMDVKCQGCFQM